METRQSSPGYPLESNPEDRWYYAEANWSETLPDWVAAHVNATTAFGGAPALFVPDNAKVAVIKGRPLALR